MEWFNTTEPNQLVIISAAIAMGMAKELSDEELNSLGNFFQLIGQNLIVIAGQRFLYELNNKNMCNSKDCSSKDCEDSTRTV